MFLQNVPAGDVGEAIPLVRLQPSRTAQHTLEGRLLEGPSCGGPVSTAQTTVNPATRPPGSERRSIRQVGDEATIQRAMVALRPCLRSDTPLSARPERPPRPGAPRSSGNAAALSAQPRPVRATAAMAYNGFARKGLTIRARLDNPIVGAA